MYTETLKMAELQEAVDFYASVDFDPNQAAPLWTFSRARQTTSKSAFGRW
jgi:hypothetical protein